ncbi:hypothetical protein LSG31_20915 [Fodinisporobacter ferrooxydans]|uniref:Uncharacterized protein n=1 Tax=Fodinisporobacter ferrooxydans TaxID=2901836 RepID=A0ABY4CIM5_9BACL|nr:hypothetical protein LSG31_20915 [Alicyclobacillaceae bacterium MYW30-H2]
MFICKKMGHNNFAAIHVSQDNPQVVASGIVSTMSLFHMNRMKMLKKSFLLHLNFHI